MPDVEETISYAIPTFKQNGVNLVYIAGFKNQNGFYATPTGHEELKKTIKLQTRQRFGSVSIGQTNSLRFN